MLDAQSLGLFFTQTFEDQHVGIDGHTDRQDDTGDTGKREDRVEHAHRTEYEDNVQCQCDVGHRTAEEVVNQHEGRHGDQAVDAGSEAFLHVLFTDGGTVVRFADRILIHLAWQATGFEGTDEVSHFLNRELSGDLPPAGNHAVDPRSGVDFVIQQDGHQLFDVVFRQTAEVAGPGVVECEIDGGRSHLVASDASTGEFPFALAHVLDHFLTIFVAQQNISFARVILGDHRVVAVFIATEGVPRVGGFFGDQGRGSFGFERLDIELNVGFADRRGLRLRIGLQVALGVERGDAEVQHARLSDESLQVAGAFQRTADARPDSVRVGDRDKLVGSRGVLSLQCVEANIEVFLGRESGVVGGLLSHFVKQGEGGLQFTHPDVSILDGIGGLLVRDSRHCDGVLGCI